MQISQVNENELGLLILGLRAIYVSNVEDERRKLVIQLETELSTRFGRMIGTTEEQARYNLCEHEIRYRR